MVTIRLERIPSSLLSSNTVIYQNIKIFDRIRRVKKFLRIKKWNFYFIEKIIVKFCLSSDNKFSINESVLSLSKYRSAVNFSPSKSKNNEHSKTSAADVKKKLFFYYIFIPLCLRRFLKNYHPIRKSLIKI